MQPATLRCEMQGDGNGVLEKKHGKDNSSGNNKYWQESPPS